MSFQYTNVSMSYTETSSDTTHQVEHERIFERIRSEASKYTLLSFDSDTAFNIGSALREIASSGPLGCWPIAISITHVNGDQPLFFANSSPGVPPDYMHFVESIRNSVKRWGKSTMYLNMQNNGPQASTDKYSFIPGGWPVKVQGVEGVVAVIVVYGVPRHPEECHKLIVQALERELQKQRSLRN